MTIKLTTGEKTLRANIRAMKAIGAKNAKIKAAAKLERTLDHNERNNRRAEDAAALRATRREMGAEIAAQHNAAVAKKASFDKARRFCDHHGNNDLRQENAAARREMAAEMAEWARDAEERVNAREAAGIPSIATMLSTMTTEEVADRLLLPMAA